MFGWRINTDYMAHLDASWWSDRGGNRSRRNTGTRHTPGFRAAADGVGPKGIRANMSIRSKRKSLLAASATALVASGIITPALAESAPMFPLSPGCSQYVFNKGYELAHGSFRMYFAADGAKVSGRVNGVREPGGRIEETFAGDITGAIQGRNIDLTVAWHSNARGRYTGVVDDRGYVQGQTYDETGGSSAIWHSLTPLVCAPAPPAPAPGPSKRLGKAPASAPVAAPAAEIATVTGDVDVYNAKNDPAGTGTVLGILRANNHVGVLGPCQPNDWCEVEGDQVPGGRGWIWGHLQLP
jgi:hypothetical protein